MREIGEHVGLASPSTVHAHLANLERAGLIKRDPTKPRALELSGRVQHEPEPSVNALPLVGQIAAGGPLLAEQNIDTYISVPEPLSRGGDEFLLRVRGDSMVDAGILEGDFVVVRRQQDARDGDIVVALVGDDESADEATVKRFFRDTGGVRPADPEDASYEPIYASARRDPRQGDRSVQDAVSVQPLHRTLDQEARRDLPRRQPGVSGLRRVPAPPLGRNRMSRVWPRDPSGGRGGSAAAHARALTSAHARRSPFRHHVVT